MYCIKFPSNFETLPKLTKKYMIVLASLLTLVTGGRVLRSDRAPNMRFYKHFECLKDNYDLTNYVSLKLSIADQSYLSCMGLGDFSYSCEFFIPESLLQPKGNLNHHTEQYYAMSRDKSCRKLLRFLYLKYDTSYLGRTLFDNILPVKYICDKQAMLKYMCLESDNVIPKNNIPNKINMSSYCINPNLAKLLGIKQIETIELLNLLGISLKDIQKYLKKIKTKDFNLVFGGFGGAMTNFAYWLEEFCRLTNVTYPFKKIYVLDDDSFELTNLFRIPLDWLTPIADYNTKSNRKVTLVQRLCYSAQEITGLPIRVSLDSLQKLNNKATYSALIGSLDISTRFLQFNPYPFLIPLHHNDNIVIYKDLSEESGKNIMVESYGQINLNYFFFNMIKMTFELIKELAENMQDYKVVSNRIREEKLIFKYSAKQEKFKEQKDYNYCLI